MRFVHGGHIGKGKRERGLLNPKKLIFQVVCFVRIIQLQEATI